MKTTAHLALALTVLTLAALTTATARTPHLSATAQRKLTPPGYRVAVALLADVDPQGVPRFLVALDDLDQASPEKVVMLLLVRGDREAVVEDSVALHTEPFRPDEPAWPPNYCFRLSKENVGDTDLFLLTTRSASGGSGAVNYNDFFTLEGHTLRLVKSFRHGRMDNYYFTVFQNAAYDADVKCVRGEKHGKAYVYTCWLQVTKFRFNGTDLVPVASERMREKKGNRFLEDDYRWISLKGALEAKEVFADGR